MAKFNSKLRELREALSLTQTELAEKLKVSLKMIQRYEKDAVPRVDKIIVLNRIFNHDFFKELEEGIPGESSDTFTKNPFTVTGLDAPPDADVAERRALARVIVNHLAKLEAFVYGRPVDDCRRDILADTTLLLSETSTGH